MDGDLGPPSYCYDTTGRGWGIVGIVGIDLSMSDDEMSWLSLSYQHDIYKEF